MEENAMKAKRGRAAVRLAAAGLLMAPVLLSACAKSNVRTVGETRVGNGDLEVKSTVRPEGRRRIYTREGASAGRQIAVNGYLWRAALDSTAFMPLVSADAYGGAIITDWYSPPESPGERFKLTVLVQGSELRSDGVKVTVFKQKRDAKGNWLDAKVAQNTGIEFENVILARARNLREQATAQ
jgi:Domain of unknown function (DUF3576)